MAKAVLAASAATLAALLIATPAFAQDTIVPQQPAPVVVTPVPTAVIVEPRLAPVGTPPIHAPVSAVAGGMSPTNPGDYATDSPITVTGRIDGVSNRDGVTSFRLQTRTEAWTVVVPAGEGGSFANGRSATVVGYPHDQIRNQLLAQSVTAGG
jgi:hypothetical protein